MFTHPISIIHLRAIHSICAITTPRNLFHIQYLPCQRGFPCSVRKTHAFCLGWIGLPGESLKGGWVLNIRFIPSRGYKNQILSHKRAREDSMSIWLLKTSATGSVCTTPRIDSFFSGQERPCQSPVMDDNQGAFVWFHNSSTNAIKHLSGGRKMARADKQFPIHFPATYSTRIIELISAYLEF